MIDVIEKSGVPETIQSRVKGPVLRHHKFCISISGCPNSCSQPQIADFGVQGRARPAVGPGDCNGCGECVRICKEGSVTIPDNQPAFDHSLCINCDDCAAICPTRAIIVEEYGQSVLVGGKLGRHPQLAQTLFEFTDEETLLASLQTSCEIFANEMREEERFANAVDRIGMGEIARRIKL
jgi:dissimilatory sulfite reductase (desulfoviridin) alpha/beta subunit